MDLRQKRMTSPGDLGCDTIRVWALWLTEVERHLGPYFARLDAQRYAWAYVHGLLSPIERKNG